MKELQEIINNKVKAMSEDGTITNAIEQGIEKAVCDAISNQFRSYGNVTKITGLANFDPDNCHLQLREVN